jgi:hypothetical protein
MIALSSSILKLDLCLSFAASRLCWVQGDQIGRIFACWAIIFIVQFFFKKIT